MRKASTAVITLTLTSLGLAAPVTSAEAASQEYRCKEEWPGRDGNMRAWEHYGCDGLLLGVTAGNDDHWGDSTGPFQAPANQVASSVMNSGFVGGRDVVAFYYNKWYQYQTGYVCLAPGEKYADNLTDNYFYNNSGQVVNDRIGSHKWVTASECAAGSWLT